jgi:hypothetical protein
MPRTRRSRPGEIANVLLNTEPNEKCNGLYNRTHTAKRHRRLGPTYGSTEHGGRRNQLTVGAAYDESHAHFAQSSQFGYLTADRGVTTVDGLAPQTARKTPRAVRRAST